MQDPSHRAVNVAPVLLVFWKHARRYPIALTLAIVFPAIVQALEIIVPLLYKQFFDMLASAAAHPSQAVVENLVWVLVAITIVGGIIWLTRRVGQFASVYLEPRVMRDLMQTSFDYLMGHSYSFFVHNFAGSLVRRINRIARSFERTNDIFIFTVIPLVVALSGIILVLFLRHRVLGVVFLVWTCVFIVIQYSFTRWKQKYNVEMAERDSAVTGALSDSITNDTTVKLFTGKKFEGQRFRATAERFRQSQSFVWGLDEWTNAVQGALFVAIEFALMYSAIQLWGKGALSVGDFALIQAYIISSFHHLWNFGNSFRKLYEAFADATEMVDILNTPHEVQDPLNARLLKVTHGAIEFRSAQFSFQKTRRVLHDFTLAIRGGEKVALVGPSGAGKSTVAKLLFRFYDIDDGEILIDGQNIARVTQKSLRENIALVPQEPILFHRTLMENIRYGRGNASDKEVVEAAKKAHCHEFITQFPGKYDTFVGERGVRLSGGERQRVAIARAILKNAPILVLDEATSSLDSESEALIQKALATLMRDKTVIVIAHRLSTIMQMDRIVIIEGGSVVMAGTHEELLSKEENIYKKLWGIQAGGFLR